MNSSWIVIRLARSLLPLAVAACMGLSAASATATTALPPELQALEQKAQSLKLNSERFSLNFLITEPSGKKISIAGSGVARLSPLAGEVVETAGSKRLVVRIIGNTVYLKYPGLARLDHGRPWVRSTESKLSAESGLNAAAAPQGLSSSFSLIDSAAESVQQVGPATVDGQATIEFTATINLSALLSRFGEKLVAKLQQAGVSTADLELYIAPNGLPVRTVTTIDVEGGTVTAANDILAADIPVSVSKPAAARTISEAVFKRIERAHAKHKRK
jgi:hypothetical protein